MNKLNVRNNPSFTIGISETVTVKWEKADNLVGFTRDTATGEIVVDSPTPSPIQLKLAGNIVTDTSDANSVLNIKLIKNGSEVRRLPFTEIASASPVSHQFYFEYEVFSGDAFRIDVQRAFGTSTVTVSANGILTHMTGSYSVIE